MPKLLELKALPKYVIWLRYSDGAQGTVDLSDLVGKGVFSLWKDAGAFEAVALSDYGAPAWGESIDLCPDALYLELTGKRPEELFPALRRAASDA
jgi:hypothetical protein